MISADTVALNCQVLLLLFMVDRLSTRAPGTNFSRLADASPHEEGEEEEEEDSDEDYRGERDGEELSPFDVRVAAADELRARVVRGDDSGRQSWLAATTTYFALALIGAVGKVALVVVMPDEPILRHVGGVEGGFD